ncbi:ATP-binding cassette domain-containing protein [Nannocystis sp. ILAH1]|uniref:ATP-binding cassette domain-containing protein n=1 Tax=unclassified Nannocystis TaxID=2627009 RepID=UPI002270CAA0|nr:ATP-binding cassette domain-containing protein [Nannocystis sp. ILAH1]MCY1072176.1 ATP-binding cassette domain-containing protein [Nannocystis sp. RBIL2]
MHGPEDTVVVRSSTTYLTIEVAGRKLQDVRLGMGPLRIGRKQDNDVVIQSACVAQHHARVEPHLQGHRIVDLGRGSGLLFRGRRVQSHVFNDGDVIRIADPVTGNFVSLTYQDLGKRAQAQPEAPVQRCALDRPAVTIGREGCDLVLPSLQVSRRHATIRAFASGHELTDHGSANGTFVNGARVHVHELKQGDVLQIGPFKLVYTGKSLDQFEQKGAMRIDARELVRLTPEGKAILHRVSLVIEPREFVALVGASGAGKSTLMAALAGVRRPEAGLVRVGSDDLYASYHLYRGGIAYVPQDDILHRHLTVEDALRYTARLRLPIDTSAAEIEARIVRVLEEVEMVEARAQRITELSGGQRKRISIASELLADPHLFFLDEPTSGLDPGLEKKMMYTLRYIADSGRTVVLVTHATANITQCDLVAFMAGGRLVYYGPPAGALVLFGVTSGDFADIYTKLGGKVGPPEVMRQGELAAEYRLWHEHHPQTKRAPTMAELWEIRFRRSDEYRIYVYERQTDSQSSGAKLRAVAPGHFRIAAEESLTSAPTPAPPPPSHDASWLFQTRVLADRYAKLIAADRKNLMILLLQAPVIGAVLLLAARPSALHMSTSTNGRLLLFLLSVVAVWFGVINSVREITKEAEIYRRERLASLRIPAYLLSKFGVLAGLCAVQSLVLMVLLLLRVDFAADYVALTEYGLIDMTRQPPLGLWGGMLVSVFLTSLSGVGLGLLISTWVSSSDKAMSTVPLALIPQLVFALALMPLPAVLAPISYLTGARWGMESMGSIAALLEPRDMTTCEFPGDPLSCEVYASVDYSPAPGHIGLVWIILAVYTLACLLLTAWMLRRRDAADK